MPITAIPQPPQRNNPATFADQGDALLGALPLFVAQANALEVNVDAKEATASEAAATAVAAAAIAQPAANYRGNWSALTGALAMPSSVAHAGQFWALNVPLANVATATPGVSASWTCIKLLLDNYSYDNRASLRSLSPGAGDQAIVEGLGLFVWTAGSTEIDDDETCFATASGRWLLEAAGWELIDAYDTVTRFGELEFDARFVLSFASSFASSFSARVLTGSANCAITSVAAVFGVAFTGTVSGAAIGDRVIATPPAQLGSTVADTARLSYHAWVSAADTVTVTITNASAAAATTNPAIRTNWPVTVIKT